MNAADIGVVLVLLGLLFIGVRRGLVGIALIAIATGLSVFVAVVAAYVVADSQSDPWIARVAAPIAFFVALGVSSWLLRSVAGTITDLLHRLPLASFDRLLGGTLAVVVGCTVLGLVVLGITAVPVANPITEQVRAARSTPVLLETGRVVAAAGARYVHVLDPLAQRFDEALRDDIRPVL